MAPPHEQILFVELPHEQILFMELGPGDPGPPEIVFFLFLFKDSGKEVLCKGGF
jgi:hypothetical protein